jgi:hypothetical protein
MGSVSTRGLHAINAIKRKTLVYKTHPSRVEFIPVGLMNLPPAAEESSVIPNDI